MKTARPHNAQMMQWKKDGFVCHNVDEGAVIPFEYVNWALVRAGKNVRVVRGNIPSVDCLQILYDESMKYLQENNIEH